MIEAEIMSEDAGEVFIEPRIMTSQSGIDLYVRAYDNSSSIFIVHAERFTSKTFLLSITCNTNIDGTINTITNRDKQYQISKIQMTKKRVVGSQ